METLLPGDCVVVTAKDTFFRRIISYLSRTPKESQTIAVHIGGISSNNTVIESLSTVKEYNFEEWKDDIVNFEIWRNNEWEDQEREKISEELYKYMGRFYGFWKLFFHVFDLVLSRFTVKEIFFFRRFLNVEKYPICSWVYVYSVYNVTGYLFNNLKPNWVDPDTMHDHMIKSKKWSIIYQK